MCLFCAVLYLSCTLNGRGTNLPLYLAILWHLITLNESYIYLTTQNEF